MMTMTSAGAESMHWWPPWKWKSDHVAREETHNADRRLHESQELRARAERVEKSMKKRIRRDRFGEMIDREVFGGGDK
jgi:hypothetical protein